MRQKLQEEKQAVRVVLITAVKRFVVGAAA